MPWRFQLAAVDRSGTTVSASILAFWLTERIRTDHAGVGLGLAIVKSITQVHDGTLTLTPRAAGGLRVTVQRPAGVRVPKGLWHAAGGQERPALLC